MNKQDMVVEIAKRSGLPKYQVEKAVGSLLKAIANSLKKKEKVTIVGFGTFKVVERKQRKGRNPQTGATIRIQKRHVPKFVVSKNFWIPPHKK